MHEDLFLLGKDYNKPNSTEVLEVSPNLVAGIAPGTRACLKSKYEGNEDGLAYLNTGDNSRLLLLSDSHFGATAGVIALTRFHEALEGVGENLEEKLFYAHLHLDDWIRQAKAEPGSGLWPGCATTLISALIDGFNLTFVNSGDSLLWLYRGDRLYPINERQQSLFLGDQIPLIHAMSAFYNKHGWCDALTEPEQIFEASFRFSQFTKIMLSKQATEELARHFITWVGSILNHELPLEPAELLQPWHPIHLLTQNHLPDWRRFRLQPDDLLLLASDGLETSASGLKPGHVKSCLKQGDSLTEKVGHLLQASQLKGGKDNLMLWLLRVC